MARSDLIVKLVKAGGEGNKEYFKKIVESIIAEEKSKQHFILANQLEQELTSLNKSSSLTLSNLFVSHPDNLENFILTINPRKSFEDLILDSALQKQLEEFINEQFRKELLHAYNLEPRHKILLVGPPGNGKTSVAEAIAQTLMIPLFIVKYETMIGSYLGETANHLKKIFDFVRTNQCVLFFDEFDAIAKERGDNQESGEIKRVVNSLLLQIDRLPSFVTVIAATNHPDLLDLAIWRRFQIQLELKKPTQQKILLWIKKFEENFDQKLPISHAVLSKNLNGLSFSEIQDFGLDIQRKYVLSLPSNNLESIINDCLTELKRKYKVK